MNQEILGDCLEIMPTLADKSIDLILCDLPYGTTNCKWDTIIPFEPLWAQYKRIIKDNGAIVLTASQPFTSALVMSNPVMFKYEWIWEKNSPTGILTAKTQPMRNHENVLVFCEGKTTYNKQPTKSNISDRALGKSNGKDGLRRINETTGTVYKLASGHQVLTENVSPRTVLHFPVVPRSTGTLHPTQKPVTLFEYLVRTYTNEGDTVLDNCAGSGTTAIAAANTNRKWILIEKDPIYYEIACKRIAEHLKSKNSELF
jgi:site-specific DNA-methyltransferase (adenine-specific)